MMQRATKVMLLSLFFLIAGAVGTTKDSLEDVEKCYISFTDEKGCRSSNIYHIAKAGWAINVNISMS